MSARRDRRTAGPAASAAPEDPIAPAGRPEDPTARAGGGLAAPGSVRHSLIELTGAAVLAEVLLALVGGAPAAAAGAVLLTTGALVTGRYVAGAGFLDIGLRRRQRVLDARELGLGDWRWTVREGLDPKGDAGPLRGRLRRLFAARLSETHGVSLTADRDRAAELVGPRLWPWIDPEAADRDGAVPAAVLLALVDRLEALQPPGPPPPKSG
ncbi:hypothetical protein ACIPYS_09085 [Kitasatospora sp. NPDC089913]|uniref:hypothetical protein n=1 Tax=Streptomycetaceae TaxID=2062 RepID=UPI00087DA1D7|nr:hypothetical protein [Streptomyces sp. TLI_053]SDS66395.1 hypothetical protein SAMN05216371_0369 [Streptomyces sp. TLI_053]